MRDSKATAQGVGVVPYGKGFSIYIPHRERNKKCVSELRGALREFAWACRVAKRRASLIEVRNCVLIQILPLAGAF